MQHDGALLKRCIRDVSESSVIRWQAVSGHPNKRQNKILLFFQVARHLSRLGGYPLVCLWFRRIFFVGRWSLCLSQTYFCRYSVERDRLIACQSGFELQRVSYCEAYVVRFMWFTFWGSYCEVHTRCKEHDEQTWKCHIGIRELASKAK